MLTIAHIINPVKVKESSELYHAQPITFESLIRAKAACINASIQICTVSYDEDRPIIPNDFEKLPNLRQSVLDYGSFDKKLPLINEIIQAAYKHTTADYLVYTNMDIILQPYFYQVVNAYLNKGYDALIINRRRVSKKYTRVSELPLVYADLGKPHPGFDCFVFKRELASRFVLGNICVGVPFIGVALAHNIFALAKRPLFIPSSNLTKHIGLEVMPPINKALYKHNRKAFNRLKTELKPCFEIRKFPYGALPIYKRALKWALNPSLFIKDWAELEGKTIWYKLKYSLNELRWRLLGR